MLEFIRLRAALEVIKELGVELKEEDFLDLEDEEYQNIRIDITGEFAPNLKWYVVSPNSLKSLKPANEVLVVNEDDKFHLLEAVKFIYKTTTGMDFDSFAERIFYVQGTLPHFRTRPKQKEGAEIIPFPTKQKKWK